jgi:hypothetical protein
MTTSVDSNYSEVRVLVGQNKKANSILIQRSVHICIVSACKQETKEIKTVIAILKQHYYLPSNIHKVYVIKGWRTLNGSSKQLSCWTKLKSDRLNQND